LGAPFELTKIKNVERMLKLAELKENEILYDLGSGDGRIIIEAVKKYKVEAVGIEINPLLVFISRKKIKKLGFEKKAKVIWGDFFKENLSNANILTTYLLQTTNDRLEKKFIKELKPGTKIISKSFTFKNIPFLKSDSENPAIRLYQIS
jgi:predicted RNA methylase